MRHQAKEMSNNFNPSEWITTAEAAELTGYTARYIRKALKRGILKGQKRGRDWFVSKAQVEAYAKEMQKLGTDKHNPWRKDRQSDGDGVN